MRRIVLMAAVAAILGFGFCGSTLMNTMAKSPASSEKTAYFTSVAICEGDSLWSIAHEYAPALGLTTQEYIDILRQMNHLEGNTIHAGCHLTIMYQGSAD